MVVIPVTFLCIKAVIKNNNRCYLLKYPIFHVEFISKYLLRYTYTCAWISGKINIYFWCYFKKKGFQFRNSQPGPSLTTYFTNTLHKMRPLLMIWASACCVKDVCWIRLTFVKHLCMLLWIYVCLSKIFWLLNI